MGALTQTAAADENTRQEQRRLLRGQQPQQVIKLDEC
jgi:hypothetical protein